MSTIAALIAFPACALAIWVLLRSPVARRLVANPSSDRYHKAPTPYFGGIGIFAGLSAGLWLPVAVGAAHPSKELLGVYAGVALLFLGGLADDLWHLNPVAKLTVQFGAAAIVLSTGTTVQLVHNDLIAGAIAVFWLVGMTNAFNLLDNMDGLAATLAGIAFAFFAIDAATVHPSHAVLAFSLAGALACAGFLPFNLRPRGKALVFMGDSGSQALGFALAGLGLSSSWKVAGTTVATLLVPILVLAVPILDTTLVTIGRLLEGRPIHQGGLDHSSHRLVRYGLSEKQAVALLALLATALGATSLTYNVLDDRRLTIVGTLITVTLLVQFASFLADVERRPVAGEARSLVQTFVAHWRRLAEVVVDFGLILLAFLAAFVIEFGWPGTVYQRHTAVVALPIVIGARYLAFIPFGLYRSIWRFAGMRDLVAITSAIVISELAALGYMSATQTFSNFSRWFFIVDGLLCVALIGASRVVQRAIVTRLRIGRDGTGRRTLIVGAGRAGRTLLHELRETAGEHVIGFVDDNRQLRRVHGIRVLGTIGDLPALLLRIAPDIVLVTIPNAPRERLDEIAGACQEADVECRFVRPDVDLDPRVILGSAAE